jgi:hypothetical protein
MTLVKRLRRKQLCRADYRLQRKQKDKRKEKEIVGRHGSFSAADAGGVKEPWLWRARDRRLQHVELEVTTRMSSDRRGQERVEFEA